MASVGISWSGRKRMVRAGGPTAWEPGSNSPTRDTSGDVRPRGEWNSQRRHREQGCFLRGSKLQTSIRLLRQPGFQETGEEAGTFPGSASALQNLTFSQRNIQGRGRMKTFLQVQELSTFAFSGALRMTGASPQSTCIINPKLVPACSAVHVILSVQRGQPNALPPGVTAGICLPRYLVHLD